MKAPQNSLVDVRTGDAIENHVRKLEDGQVDDVLPDDTEDRDAVRGMASPETREVVRSALRKVPCFINLDDEKKFSYVCHRLRRLHSAPGETVISEGEQGSTVYILLEGRMECFVAGVKVRTLRVVSFLILRPFAGRGDLGRHRGRRTGHAHERRAIGNGRGGHGLRLLGAGTETR